MKKIIYLSLLVILSSCAQPKVKPIVAEIVDLELKYNEGTLTDGTSLYVTNFGGEQLNPLNTDAKGYILKLTEGVGELFVPANGNLNAPKGMAMMGDSLLLVADVGALKIFSMQNRDTTFAVINLPEGNSYVNDVVVNGDDAYVSVTNSGKIFKINIPTGEILDYADVPGANGLLLDGNKMYIASYPADGITTENNVIYVIEEITNPIVTKLITREGQYDGLALSADKSKLYFSSWVNGEIGSVNLENKEVQLFDISNYKFTGAADITLLNGKLYIPDLPNSKLVAIPVE